MGDFKEDPRFAHIATDPRFRPMPKSRKKVKIDSRFQSLFTNKDFSHRTDLDKRGRPIIHKQKKNRHAMQRFYELSSESDSDEDDSDSDEDSEEEIISDEQGEEKHTTQKESKIKVDPQVLQNENKGKNKKTSRSRSTSTSTVTSASLNVKRKRTDSASEEEVTDMKKKKSKKVSNGVNGTNGRGPVEREPSEESDDVEEEDEVDDETSSDDDTEGEDLPDFTEDFQLEETEVDHKWNEHQNDAEIVSDSTSRLAVCNMDWDFVKAQDLFMLFKSFVPEGGSIRSVAIYPSEYGKERMTEEARLGPKEMREAAKSAEDAGKKSKKKDQKKQKDSEKAREEAQIEKLREYQLNRLKYYYAVVACDTVATADNVYTECDGREYELSSVRLDLRFIPEDMPFDDAPREVFSENQSVVDYQPAAFNSTALSQAKVEVTWDETEFDRLSRKISTLQQKELESIVEDNKYADIIAPPDSDSDQDEDGRPEWLKAILANDEEEDEDKEVTEEDKIRLYRSVLMDKVEEEEAERKKEEDGDVDMVMEVQPGLKSAVEKKLKKKAKKEEQAGVVGEYLEKKKTKKKKKKAEKRKAKLVEGEEAFSDDDIPNDVDIAEFQQMMGEEDSGVQKTSNKKKRKGNKAGVEGELSEKERAELELVLMDEGSKSLAKPELVKDNKKKSKKSKKKMAMLKKKAEQEKEDYVLDVEDNRFGALYTSHHFHIDPNAPQFKKTKNMVRLVDEQIKRKDKKSSNKSRKSPAPAVVDNSDIEDSRKKSQSLIESLKRKMKK